jgi:putative oxidoreductase
MGLSTVARPLLASIFVYGGIDAFRNPAAKAPRADKLMAGLVRRAPGLSSTEQLVRLDGAAKVAGGAALALGILPRLAAAGLAMSLIPTTAAGHCFWEESDPQVRQMHLLQFVKNAAILGGLVYAASDTQSRKQLAQR